MSHAAAQVSPHRNEEAPLPNMLFRLACSWTSDGWTTTYVATSWNTSRSTARCPKSVPEQSRRRLLLSWCKHFRTYSSRPVAASRCVTVVVHLWGRLSRRSFACFAMFNSRCVSDRQRNPIACICGSPLRGRGRAPRSTRSVTLRNFPAH